MTLNTHTWRDVRIFRGFWLLPILVSWLLGCASPTFQVSRTAEYRYFVPAPDGDMWSPKIAAWQAREEAHLARASAHRVAPPVSGPGPTSGEPAVKTLRSRYEELRARLLAEASSDPRRSTAQRVALWIQDRSVDHYIPDGPIDHWATLEETLQRDGDDCDGLELLTFHLLRELGFGKDRVYRAIVVRPSDGQHHMVTLWFDDLKDPWVLDPTGAMTLGMPRMSDRPDWVPLKVFGLERDFTVEPLHRSAS